MKDKEIKEYIKLIIENNDNIVSEGVHDKSIFKAIWTAGGPGSGKSYMAGKTMSGLGLKVISSDDALVHLMSKKGLSLDMSRMTPEEQREKDVVRSHAKELTSKREFLYNKGKLGVVVDGTGRDFDKIKKQKQRYGEYGYDTFMVFVNTSLDVALERNAKRKRRLPEELVKQQWLSVQNNIGKFQNEFGQNNIIIIDNNEGSDEYLFDVWKAIKKFVEKEPKNPIAKMWIKTQLGQLKKR